MVDVSVCVVSNVNVAVLAFKCCVAMSIGSFVEGTATPFNWVEMTTCRVVILVEKSDNQLGSFFTICIVFVVVVVEMVGSVDCVTELLVVDDYLEG